jgi:hypothetical protein
MNLCNITNHFNTDFLQTDFTNYNVRLIALK